jgi:hypothetical protein
MLEEIFFLDAPFDGGMRPDPFEKVFGRLTHGVPVITPEGEGK